MDMNAIDWLLDSDPAIRWQAMRDLTDGAAAAVAAERGLVATSGWGAELLARQQPDGTWGGDPSLEQWSTSTEWFCLQSLGWLVDMGIDPTSSQAVRAANLVRDNIRWHWWDNHPFFDGEVEPCINGRVVSTGAYFGQDVSRLVDRLLGEQMADGGWNCEQENGATVGSFSTSINVLEGLAEFERATGGSRAVADARRRGEAYLLERRLLRRLSNGELIDPDFSELSFPTGWHYDVLRALDYFRATGGPPDPRMAEALDVVRSSPGIDGRWLLGAAVPDQLDIGTGEQVGEPSRWITLRALRVLRWAAAAR